MPWYLGRGHLRSDVKGDDPLEIWACKLLRTKYFHGVSSGNQHPYLLKSRYGKVSLYVSSMLRCSGLRPFQPNIGITVTALAVKDPAPVVVGNIQHVQPDITWERTDLPEKVQLSHVVGLCYRPPLLHPIISDSSDT